MTNDEHKRLGGLEAILGLDALIKVVKLRENAKVPVYSSLGASGADICSCETYDLKPSEIYLFKTGLKFEIPEWSEMQIRPRSGLAAKHGITVLNTPGTLDADYRGELGIILINLGGKNYLVEEGARIAQAIIMPVVRAQYALVDALSDTKRGEGGFGSTGKA